VSDWGGFWGGFEGVYGMGIWILDGGLGGVVDEGLDVWLVDEYFGRDRLVRGVFYGCWRHWGLTNVETIGFD